MVLLLLQVQDMNLLHTLIAGCLSYKEWLERRDMLVSIVIAFCTPVVAIIPKCHSYQVKDQSCK